MDVVELDPTVIEAVLRFAGGVRATAGEASSPSAVPSAASGAATPPWVRRPKRAEATLAAAASTADAGRFVVHEGDASLLLAHGAPQLLQASVPSSPPPPSCYDIIWQDAVPAAPSPLLREPFFRACKEVLAPGPRALWMGGLEGGRR